MSLHALSALALTVLGLILIPVVMRGHFRSPVHRLFSIYLLGLAFYGGSMFAMRGSPSSEQDLFWEKTMIALAPLTAVIFYYFTVYFTGIKIKKWLLLSFCSICVLLLLISRTDLLIREMRMAAFGYAAVGGPLLLVTVLLIYILLGMAFRNLLKRARISSHAEERNRLVYIMIGLGAAFLGGVFDALAILGLPLYPSFIIGNMIFFILTTIAIVRYHLLDIHVIVRKGAAYFLVSASVAIPYVGIILLFSQLTKRVFPIWSHVVLLILLALGLQPIWGKMQQLVNRWFYRGRYDYLKALESFNWDTQSLTDSQEIGSTMVNLLAGALRASSVYLLQPSPPDGDFAKEFCTSASSQTDDIFLKRVSSLIRWLENSNRILSYADIEVIPQLQGITYKEKETLLTCDHANNKLREAEIL